MLTTIATILVLSSTMAISYKRVVEARPVVILHHSDRNQQQVNSDKVVHDLEQKYSHYSEEDSDYLCQTFQNSNHSKHQTSFPLNQKHGVLPALRPDSCG